MKLRSYIIFFLLFGVLPDFYITLVVLPSSQLIWKFLVVLPSLPALICLLYIAAGKYYTESITLFSYLIFIFEFPKFIFLLFSSAGRYILGIAHPTADWIAFGAGAAVSAFFCTLIFHVTTHLVVKEVEISLKGLPEQFKGLRVCQLTDMHLGSFGKNINYIRRVVDTTLELKPDLILFTGDLVNFDSREALPYLDELSRLEAPLGIFAIRGNHDYLMHGYHHTPEGRELDKARVLEIERGLGWNVLLNSNAILTRNGAQLALVGVENITSNPYLYADGGDLKKACDGLPDGIFKILLSHDPSHWRMEVVPCADIPLTLSGHTHGLKYKLIGLRPSTWKLPNYAGIYRQGEKILYVSEGLGSAFAFRLGGYPKIDIITLI